MSSGKLISAHLRAIDGHIGSMVLVESSVCNLTPQFEINVIIETL